jgi:hypothetical protein
MSASRSILSREWFKRVWVFQELVLSRDPCLQAGHLRVRWTEFCDLVLQKGKDCHGMSPQAGEGASSVEPVDTGGVGRQRQRNRFRILQEMDSARSSETHRSLVQLLQARRGMGASDPRDIVYAHLGMASSPDGKPLSESRYLAVDYKRSICQVYTDVARYILEAQGTSEGSDCDLRTLIDCLPDRSLEERSRDIPSWVPDWRLPPSVLLSERRHRSHYAISTNRSYPVITTSGKPLMGLAGYICDTIELLGPIVPSKWELPEAYHEQWLDYLDQLVASIHGTWMMPFLYPSLPRLQWTIERGLNWYDVFFQECQAWIDGPLREYRKSKGLG